MHSNGIEQRIIDMQNETKNLVWRCESMHVLNIMSLAFNIAALFKKLH